MVLPVDELLAVDAEHAEHFSLGVYTRCTDCKLLEASLRDEAHDCVDVLFSLLSNGSFLGRKTALSST